MKNGSKPAKPEKPYPGFPLFPHAAGQWAKKIRGKLVYFGPWATPEKALERFNREWPYLKDGRTPPPEHISEDGATVREVCNDFLEAKNEKVKAGDLHLGTFSSYFRTCEMLADHFGDRRVDDLRPEDFRDYRARLAKRFGTQTLKSEITRARMVFGHAFDNELIEKPVRYGSQFEKPSAKRLRREENSRQAKLFTAGEILKLMDAAKPHLRAMIFLGINGGLGNTDVASMPIDALNLESGWVDFPRVKTEIPRRIPLWPQTVEALRESLERRPKPADEESAGLAFLTPRGNPWVRYFETTDKPGAVKNTVTTEFSKLMKSLGINGRRGLGFYTLRHCFETVGGESRDQVAVDAIMGHVDPSMGGNYRHGISDDRLRAVTETVRDWLFGTEGGAE